MTRTMRSQLMRCFTVSPLTYRMNPFKLHGSDLHDRIADAESDEMRRSSTQIPATYDTCLHPEFTYRPKSEEPNS